MQTLTILLMFVLCRSGPAHRNAISRSRESHSRRDRDESSHRHRTGRTGHACRCRQSVCSRSNVGRTRSSFSLWKKAHRRTCLCGPASGRWSYELVPAASPATMHFAIDQQAVPISTEPRRLSAGQFALRMPASSPSVCGGDASVCKADPKPWREVRPHRSGRFHHGCLSKGRPTLHSIRHRQPIRRGLTRSRIPKCSRSSPRSRQPPCTRSAIRRSVRTLRRRYAAGDRHGSRPSNAKCRRSRFQPGETSDRDPDTAEPARLPA